MIHASCGYTVEARKWICCRAVLLELIMRWEWVDTRLLLAKWRCRRRKWIDTRSSGNLRLCLVQLLRLRLEEGTWHTSILGEESTLSERVCTGCLRSQESGRLRLYSSTKPLHRLLLLAKRIETRLLGSNQTDLLRLVIHCSEWLPCLHLWDELLTLAKLPLRKWIGGRLLLEIICSGAKRIKRKTYMSTQISHTYWW